MSDPTTIITYLESANGLVNQDAVTVLGATHDGLRIVSLQFESDPGCHTMSAASARKMGQMLLNAACEDNP